MGKFKELAQEIKEIKRDQQRRQLVAKYPSIEEFINAAFAEGKEDKVYKLILAFKEEDTCEDYVH